jgi:probable HAF family extracellular repeat protein
VQYASIAARIRSSSLLHPSADWEVDVPFLRACVAVVAALLLVAPLVAQSSFIQIPRLGPSFSTLWAVNELGDAVGFSETAGFDSEHAVLWKDGQLIDLGILPNSEFTASRAYAVNDLGQVVGISFEVNTFHIGATRWENGQAMPFPARYSACRPVGINNDGAIVAVHCGVILPDGQLLPLGSLPGYPENTPAAINDAGVVAGTLSDNQGHSIPYRWARGTLTPLDLPPGATSGRATAINARGAIVGTVSTPTTAILEPVIWEDRTPAPLGGTWGRFSGQAWGINARGEAVFNGSDLITGEGYAFVCLRGTCRAIDPLGIALDINNSGLAVGRHFFEDLQEYHGVLWPKSLTRVPVRLPDRALP